MSKLLEGWFDNGGEKVPDAVSKNMKPGWQNQMVWDSTVRVDSEAGKISDEFEVVGFTKGRSKFNILIKDSSGAVYPLFLSEFEKLFKGTKIRLGVGPFKRGANIAYKIL